MTSDYVPVTGLADLFEKAGELSVQTMIFDVEPLVAPWHSSQEALDQGIARILGDVASLAQRWNKPLAARLLPVPGKKAGDRTEFTDSRMANTVIR